MELDSEGNPELETNEVVMRMLTMLMQSMKTDRKDTKKEKKKEKDWEMLSDTKSPPNQSLKNENIAGDKETNQNLGNRQPGNLPKANIPDNIGKQPNSARKSEKVEHPNIQPNFAQIEPQNDLHAHNNVTSENYQNLNQNQKEIKAPPHIARLGGDRRHDIEIVQINETSKSEIPQNHNTNHNHHPNSGNHPTEEEQVDVSMEVDAEEFEEHLRRASHLLENLEQNHEIPNPNNEPDLFQNHRALQDQQDELQKLQAEQEIIRQELHRDLKSTLPAEDCQNFKNNHVNFHNTQSQNPMNSNININNNTSNNYPPNLANFHPRNEINRNSGLTPASPQIHQPREPLPLSHNLNHPLQFPQHINPLNNPIKNTPFNNKFNNLTDPNAFSQIPTQSTTMDMNRLNQINMITPQQIVNQNHITQSQPHALQVSRNQAKQNLLNSNNQHLNNPGQGNGIIGNNIGGNQMNREISQSVTNNNIIKMSPNLPGNYIGMINQRYETPNRHICLEHQSIADLICHSDQKIICSNCALFGVHKGHNYVKFDDFRNDCRGKIQSLKSEFEKMKFRRFLREGDKEAQFMREKVKDKKQLLFSEIDAASAEMVKKIREREAQVKDLIEKNFERFGEVVDEWSTVQMKIKDKAGNLEHRLLKLSKAVMSPNTDFQFLIENLYNDANFSDSPKQEIDELTKQVMRHEGTAADYIGGIIVLIFM